MTLARYSIGFVLSLLLTLVAYYLVVYQDASPWILLVLTGLALVQMVVQLVYFLHLGDGEEAKYRRWSYISMAGVLIILVVGSLWIMANLNYNMMHMTPEQKDYYMDTEHNKGF